MKNKTIREIIKMTAPVMAGYMVLGMGFGILMIKNGFTLTHVLLMSIFVFLQIGITLKMELKMEEIVF